VISDYSSLCSWPSLPEPYATALRRAVDFIFHEVEPVGVVATGTIIRGTAQPNSDLDVYVVHLASYRRRIQRFFCGVPTEIFINPPSAVRRYFAEEDDNGRRLTAHMLATGVVIFRGDPVVDELRAEAAQWLDKETHLSDFERVTTRYGIASRLEDGLDLLDTDGVTASMLLGDAVLAMLEYLCKADRGRIPRRKDLLGQLEAEHPDVAALAAEFFGASGLPDRARLATEIADRTIGARGFFEWDSGPGPAPS
jgi:predicted nucleotidyltransferase